MDAQNSRILYAGDNGSQTFFETEHTPKTVIIRLKDEPWVCVELDGQLSPKDKDRQRRAKRGVTYGLANGSMTKLLTLIKNQYGISLLVSSRKSWQGKTPMKLRRALTT